MHISPGTRDFAVPSRPLSARPTRSMILHAALDATCLNASRFYRPALVLRADFKGRVKSLCRVVLRSWRRLGKYSPPPPAATIRVTKNVHQMYLNDLNRNSCDFSTRVVREAFTQCFTVFCNFLCEVNKPGNVICIRLLL